MAQKKPEPKLKTWFLRDIPSDDWSHYMAWCALLDTTPAVDIREHIKTRADEMRKKLK